jgi:hypothetical protein
MTKLVLIKTMQSCAMATELATCGWLVEVNLISEGKSDSRFFAVGTCEAEDAENLILCYPGITPEDRRNARRRLSKDEIAWFQLRERGCEAAYSGVATAPATNSLDTALSSSGTGAAMKGFPARH